MPDAPSSAGTVTIEFLGRSSLRTIEIANVANGTTLESVMRKIKEIPIRVTGSGTTAFVDKIGDQETDSTDGWTFKIDGAYTNQGVGGTVLTPPTTVTWSFGDFDGE